MGEIEDAIESRLEDRLKHFEWYLSEKYNLDSDYNQDLGGSNPPNSVVSAPPISQESSPNMYSEDKKVAAPESGLQSEALNTVCYIGKYSNKTLREVWGVDEDGQAAVKVFAKSQHSISKPSAIVVAFYNGDSQWIR